MLYGREMEGDSRQGSHTQKPQKHEGSGHSVGNDSRLQEEAAGKVAYSMTCALGKGHR